jgi:hypothetical protein
MALPAGPRAPDVATFELVRRTSLPVEETWSRLTDWERHGGLIPLTTVTVTGPANHVGAVFVARTSIGQLGFDDPMEITVWRPPEQSGHGECSMVKRGSVVRGGAELTVSRVPGGSEVRWREEATLSFGGRLLDAVNKHAGKLVFGRLIDRLLR